MPYFDGWLFHPAWCQPSRQQAGKSAVIHEGSSIAPAGSLLQTWRTIRAGLEVPDPLQHLHNPWHNLFHEPCSPPPCSKQVASSCPPEISFPAPRDLFELFSFVPGSSISPKISLPDPSGAFLSPCSHPGGWVGRVNPSTDGEGVCTTSSTDVVCS